MNGENHKNHKLGGSFVISVILRELKAGGSDYIKREGAGRSTFYRMIIG